MTIAKQHQESLLTETRSLLRRYGLRARKGLAQHFLISRYILQKIVAAAELSPEDVVMEIGSGLGVLTRELVKTCRGVIAVELDEKLAAILKENLASNQNVAVINRDILQVDPGELIREYYSKLEARSLKTEALNFRPQTPNYKVVANLPYYITSAVLRHILEAFIKPSVMVIMVQKEIAQQITAPAGKMSLLSVSVQFYGNPKVISYVPAACFYPPPKVDSAILRIDLYPAPAIAVKDTDSFFRLVKAGFKANRKQLVNSLSRGLELSKYDILPLLEKAGIDFTRRAETLSLEEWGKLYNSCLGTEKC